MNVVTQEPVFLKQVVEAIMKMKVFKTKEATMQREAAENQEAATQMEAGETHESTLLVQVINFAMTKRGNIHRKASILPRLSVFFSVETISSQ